MGSLGIVMMSPSFDQHLGFTERGEDLGVQQLVPEFTVKAFVVAALVDEQARTVDMTINPVCVIVSHSV